MKRLSQKPLSVVILCLSLLMCVGSLTFLGACVHEDGSVGTCHWAAVACSALGGLCALYSLLALLITNKDLSAGLNLAVISTSILSALLPGHLMPLCLMSSMRCQSLMKPSMVLLGLAIAILAAVQAYLLLTVKKGSR